jgi:hypothetical protein
MPPAMVVVATRVNRSIFIILSRGGVRSGRNASAVSGFLGGGSSRPVDAFKG